MQSQTKSLQVQALCWLESIGIDIENSSIVLFKSGDISVTMAIDMQAEDALRSNDFKRLGTYDFYKAVQLGDKVATILINAIV